MASSHYQPQYQHPILHKSAAHGASSSSPAGAPSFTSAMRDRQARASRSADASDDSDSGASIDYEERKFKLGAPPPKEDFGRKERREMAIAYLDNPELLMMYAQSKGDSIPAARLHFTKMMCGYDPESLEEVNNARMQHHQRYLDVRQAQGLKERERDRDRESRRGGERAAGR